MFVPLKPRRDDENDVQELIDQLEASTLLKKNGKSTKFTNTINKTDIEITSWKFNEWDYGKENKVKLPCNARGLFSIGDEIAVRGYDKFFNVNEVPSTKVEFLQENTSGPYELTLKENGCIIFISGLENGELIVCSKHSTGQRDDLTRNHAIQGEIEIERQLSKVNKTTKELGRLLFDLNVTAVAELCDDEFEEHVLPYSRDDSGLYLHGLNFNTIKFRTYPMSQVNAFAAEWGFKMINYFEKNSFKELWEFLQESAKTGTYENREVEGFVIRCHSKGDNFFFKYKFEEPYLLYRQLREVTKTYASNKMPLNAIVNKTKKHKYITFKYLKFIEKLFNDEPSYKENYLNGFGIIKIRQLFLKDNGLKETDGMSLIKNDDLDDKLKELTLNIEPTSYKYVLIPIATIGCGKTTVFQTLINLFPNWSHIQNDNISNNSKNKLVDSCLGELAKNDTQLVFCDRNNHQKRERKQLFDSFLSMKDNYLPVDVGLKFIAINFVSKSLSKQQLWDVTYDRICKRGDNHQSIKFESNENLAKSIMDGFIKRFQPLDTNFEPDNQFDFIVDMEISENSSLDNAKIVLEALKQYPNLIDKAVSADDMEASFKTALDYKPSYTKTFGKTDKNKSKDNARHIPSKKDKKAIVYYGVRIDTADLLNNISKTIGSHEIWCKLKDLGRVQEDFHITLSHISAAKKDTNQLEIWNELNQKFDSESILSKPTSTEILPLEFYCDVKLNKIVVAHDKLICVDSSIIGTYDASHNPAGLKCSNTYSHITIGTVKPEITASQSNLILTELFGKCGYDLQDGTYTVDDSTVEVFNFENVILQKQVCFAHF